MARPTLPAGWAAQRILAFSRGTREGRACRDRLGTTSGNLPACGRDKRVPPEHHLRGCCRGRYAKRDNDAAKESVMRAGGRPVVSMVEHLRAKSQTPRIAIYPFHSVNAKSRGQVRSPLTATANGHGISQVKVSDLVVSVKDALPVFSKDFYNHFKQARPQGDFLNGLRYSLVSRASNPWQYALPAADILRRQPITLGHNALGFLLVSRRLALHIAQD